MVDYSKLNNNQNNGDENITRKIIHSIDYIYQSNFNVSQLITFKNKNNPNNSQDLLVSRKRILGNSHLVIIFQENNYNNFNTSLINSSVIMIYIVIKPLAKHSFLISLKENPKSKYKILNKILNWFDMDIVVNYDTLPGYIKQLSNSLNNLINYYLQKEDLYQAKKDNNVVLNSYFSTNLTYRYIEIEKICNKFKVKNNLTE